MKKYEQFIDELRENLNDPLKQLIQKFWSMRNESTEENLKEFLSYFKHYAKKFDQIINNIENMPKNDLIGNTFNHLIVQLDEQISILNKNCMNNLENLNLNTIDLNELSNQSDQLFNDILSITPRGSPSNSKTTSPSISMNDLSNI
jgi:hypothetical protein